MNRARIRYGDYSTVDETRKAILVELLIDGKWEFSTAFPMENFQKNDKLPIIMINCLANLKSLGYEISYEVYDLTEE